VLNAPDGSIRPGHVQDQITPPGSLTRTTSHLSRVLNSLTPNNSPDVGMRRTCYICLEHAENSACLAAGNHDGHRICNAPSPLVVLITPARRGAVVPIVWASRVLRRQRSRRPRESFDFRRSEPQQQNNPGKSSVETIPPRPTSNKFSLSSSSSSHPVRPISPRTGGRRPGSIFMSKNHGFTADRPRTGPG